MFEKCMYVLLVCLFVSIELILSNCSIVAVVMLQIFIVSWQSHAKRSQKFVAIGYLFPETVRNLNYSQTHLIENVRYWHI